MEYFAGLDVSMAETHICVVARTGAVIHKAKVASTPADIAAELAQVPSCRRILFETGRMAPMLFHGLSQLGLPVVCVESRQAYQALKSLQRTRPIATTRAAWRIWHEPGSSSRFT
jgi:transposase